MCNTGRLRDLVARDNLSQEASILAGQMRLWVSVSVRHFCMPPPRPALHPPRCKSLLIFFIFAYTIMLAPAHVSVEQSNC